MFAVIFFGVGAYFCILQEKAQKLEKKIFCNLSFLHVAYFQFLWLIKRTLVKVILFFGWVISVLYKFWQWADMLKSLDKKVSAWGTKCKTNKLGSEKCYMLKDN